MFINLCRLAVVCTLCICVAALQHSSYRLVVGDGGYARLLKPAPSLTDLTLAGWVNVTEFPNGVAPILTAVSPDASSQVAFFLRHDGLGVLWGGPPSVPQYQLDQVDRHPRTQWIPVDSVSEKRKRRDAVDYSGGLGDIENIMADPRSGRSYDTWTPYSFVDVDTMGVADLEASPSGLNADLHLLPTRDGFSRSESYNDWTIVPYELAMQESDPYDLHLVQPEPRIITQPSGGDDFVLFNWNVPQPPKPSIPQSPNEWSPIWQPDTESSKDIPVQEDVIKQPETVTWTENSPGAWSSHVTEVKLGPNHWSPYGIRGAAFTNQNSHQQPPSASSTTPQPRTPTTPKSKTTRIRTTPWPTRRTIATARPTPPKPKPSRPAIPTFTTPRSALRWRTSKRTTTTTPTPPTVSQQKFQFSTSRFTTTPITTTQRPQTREPNISRTTLSSRQSSRMPLWKLIKQPSISHFSSTKSDIQTTTTTTSTTTTTTTTQRPTTARLTTRKNLPQILSSRFTTTRPRPVSAALYTPHDETTDKPQIMGQKSKVSIWSSNTDIHKPNKEHNYNEKWSGKSQGSVNTVSKHRSVSITPYHVEEFQRAMEGLPTVKDGNTAVVYSVPITDVEAFNTMYEHYQAQSAPKPPSTTTIAPTVIHDEIEEKHEEETNENQLGENNLHLQDNISFQFTNEPETTFEETAAPAMTEEEAVLIPTEEPLPPTPSRSDIPIAEEAQGIKTSEEVVFEVSQQPPTTIKTKQENVQDNNKEDKPVVILVVDENNDKIHEPQIFSNKTYTTEPSTSTTTIHNSEVKENVETIPSDFPAKDDVKLTTPKPEITEAPFTLESKYMPQIPVQKDLPTETKETNKPYFSETVVSKVIQEKLDTEPIVSTEVQKKLDIPEPIVSTQVQKKLDIPEPIVTTEVQKKLDIPEPIVTTEAQKKLDTTTSRPKATLTTEQSTITPVRTTSNKPPSRPYPEETVSAGEKKSDLQSNNFAVFHLTEDDIPYYPRQEQTVEEVFSVDELYQPEGILVTQEDVHPVSHYQEPSHLYHQQLPPEYKYEEAPQPIAYGGPLKQVSDPNVEDIEDILFSADPQKLIEQGFLPQPVHYVSTQEEADQWMQEQYEKQPQIEERVFVVDSTDTVNNVPVVSPPTTETPDVSGNFHFKILPFNFLENQWYHLAFTWSSRDHQVGVYINGELAGTLTDVLSSHLTMAGGGLTILGQTLLPDLTDFDPTSQFIGEMSDINMWGQRLGSEDVRTLYQCKAHIPVSPALSWHQLSMRFYSDVYIQEDNALCGA